MVRYRGDPVTDEQGGAWMNAQGKRNGLIAVRPPHLKRDLFELILPWSPRA